MYDSAWQVSEIETFKTKTTENLYKAVCIYIYIYIGSSHLLELHKMGWGGGVGC